MARQTPYGTSEDGRNYVCALDGAVIPDGVTVLGAWTDDVLEGVRVEDAAGITLHACGRPVRGDDLTPEQRIAARTEDDYLAETGA